ncbi:MAG: hypothetical protein MK074_00005 [Phycisphaerales bacterium]|nr:hypothetical protein [Phycisphaerales bacterium]
MDSEHQTSHRGGGLLDPGWCFVLAGLALVAAAVLIPAWRDVVTLEHTVATLESRIERAQARQRTGREVLEALRAEDPVTWQRLVAWQWNLVPLGDEAIIRERHDGGLAGWVDARTGEAAEVPAAVPTSMAEQFVAPRLRPWAVGVGGLCLLIGIVALPLPGRGVRTRVVAETG